MCVRSREGRRPTIRKLYCAVSDDGREWEGFRPRASTEGVPHQSHLFQSFLRRRPNHYTHTQQQYTQCVELDQLPGGY